jgi:hypothetical protein
MNKKIATQVLMFVLIPFYGVYRTRKNLEARD